MTNRWLVVPVKRLAHAKSRLAGVLPSAVRTELVTQVLLHTLDVARESALFARILVVSHDKTLLRLAQAAAAAALVERGRGLNRALTQASQVAQAGGATALLALPADLPLLTAADLHALCALADQGTEVVLAASRDGGTNALLQPLPPLIPYAFGVKSFARHQELAMQAGCRLRLYASPTIAYDLDRPTDLAELTNMQGFLPSLRFP